MNTLRNKVPSIIIHEDKNKIDKPIEQNVIERQHKLKKLVKKYKVRKRRFTLGKDKKNGKIGKTTDRFCVCTLLLETT